MRWIFFLLLLVNAIGFGWWMQGLWFSAPPQASAFAEAGGASLPDGAKRFLLIREADPAELVPRAPPTRRDSKPAAAPAPRPAPITASKDAATPSTVSPRVCYRLGPFPGKNIKKNRIDAVRTWLDARRVTAKLHRNQRREVTLHWVYLPPFKTLAEAKKQAARMRKKGVKDIFLLNRGDMKNVISLGVFSKRASTGKRLEALKRKGYTAMVGSRYGTRKATWFTVAPPAGITFPKSDFGKRFPSLEVAVEACEDE